MALYAFDGTGKEDEGDVSNILEFFRGYRDDRKNNDPEEQLGSLYLKGIGTRAETRIGDAAAQAFGLGGHKRVRQALDRLENNQAAEDPQVRVAAGGLHRVVGRRWPVRCARPLHQCRA
jgi:hypothetical protein